MRRMDVLDKDTDYWSKRSSHFDKLNWVNNDKLLDSMLRAMNTLDKNTKLLDAGTGTGTVLKAVHEISPDTEKVGIDICPTMLKKMDKRYGVKLLQQDVYNLYGIENDTFDVVTARMLFHHLFKPLTAMSEIKRVLKPGGQCILCEGNPPNLEAREWYTEMFKYKEERVTLMESDLVNFFVEMGFVNIVSRTVILEGMSILNWLENSTENRDNNDIIYRMHRDAPDNIKHAYRMRFEENDILMNWKFTIVSGEKSVNP